jgi:hypothetical protein
MRKTGIAKTYEGKSNAPLFQYGENRHSQILSRTRRTQLDGKPKLPFTLARIREYRQWEGQMEWLQRNPGEGRERDGNTKDIE